MCQNIPLLDYDIFLFFESKGWMDRNLKVWVSLNCTDLRFLLLFAFKIANKVNPYPYAHNNLNASIFISCAEAREECTASSMQSHLPPLKPEA